MNYEEYVVKNTDTINSVFTSNSGIFLVRHFILLQRNIVVGSLHFELLYNHIRLKLKTPVSITSR